MGNLSLPAKLSLLAGVFQQAALVLIIRYSKTRNQSGGGNDSDSNSIPYLTSVAVMSAEIFKLCLSYILEVITTRQQQETSSLPPNNKSSSSIIGKSYSTLHRMLTLNQESIKLIVPALLYVIQNNLLFVALTNLSVPTYQVSNQGKLLTTALISRVLLKKKITTMQYCAITLLGLGVAIVNLSEHQINNESSSSVTSVDGRNQKLGFLAVFISCITSGFAGVYFEFVLKTSKQSVHCRNFQLAFWSCLLAITQIMYKDLQQVKSHGLFHGFDMIVVLVVVAQAMTGFVVSMMIKYADTVLKGFAIAVAAIVAAVASIFLFDTKINSIFFVGALMVAVSVKMYSYFSDEHATIIMRPIYILILATSSLSLCLLYNVAFHLTPNFQPDAELKDPKGLSLMDLSFSLILIPYLMYRYQVRINLWFRKMYDNKLIMLTATVISMMSATIITKKIIYPHSCHDQFIMTDVGYMFGTGSGHNMQTICSGKVWEPHVAKAVSEYLYHQGHAIDVGAFYGYHTMRLAKAASPYKVYAFEGRRDAVNILEKNLYRNNAEHLVEVKQEVINEDWKLSSELETELMKEPVSFIKIDCEGCEIAFLKGARSVIEKWHPVIVAEIQDDESRNSVVRLGGQQMIKPIGGRSEAIELMIQMDYTVDALVDEYGQPTWDYIALYSGNPRDILSWS